MGFSHINDYMKVLHVSGAKGWGGNEQQIAYIFPELRKLGVENIVFGVKDSKLHQYCKKMNIPFFNAKSDKLNKIVNYRFFKEIVNYTNPDLIHLHTSDSLTVYAISDILYDLKTKVVFSKKGMGASSSFFSNLKYNYKGLDSIICVSNTVKRELGKILNSKSNSKSVVVHDCVSLDIVNLKPTINLKEVYSIGDEFKIVGNIANHSGAKDLPTFINTVDEVVNNLKRKDIKFIQIGEFTKYTDQLKQLAKEKGVEQFLIFTGKIENASSLVSQFDVFLMTSQREGGPTSVLESMLIGTPVVSTQVGVVPDVIKDGINGFVAPIKDYKQLANKLITLLDSDEIRIEFAAKSKTIIEKEFIGERIAKQTKDEYLRVVTTQS